MSRRKKIILGVVMVTPWSNDLTFHPIFGVVSNDAQCMGWSIDPTFTEHMKSMETLEEMLACV